MVISLVNLSLDDATQTEILPHLQDTEDLLACVASKLSKRRKEAQIVALPDLGLPLNVTRICGGFFTGAYYHWNTDVPFVPIDATVNCCGVSVFRLPQSSGEHRQISSLIEAARLRHVQKTQEDFVWNFESGNHFIAYGKSDFSGCEEYYAVFHASAGEWKEQNEGLYPTPGNWFWNDVQVEAGHNGRFLRYIAGKTADKFINRAQELHSGNRKRLHHFAAMIFGEDVEEVLHQPHYGMPTRQSIAIGCQWQAKPFLWLTAPNLPLTFIAPYQGGANHLHHAEGDVVLTPHGLGMKTRELTSISLDSQGVTLGDRFFSVSSSLKNTGLVEIRCGSSQTQTSAMVGEVLKRCPGHIEGIFQPIYNHHRGVETN